MRCKGLFLRSSFSSSRLVRQLGQWAPVDADPRGMDFAERLSLWLNAFDAIRLQSAHQTLRGIPAGAANGRPALTESAFSDITDEVQRVRTALAAAIAYEPVALSIGDAADAIYAPYRQRHQELQRQMEQRIGALREKARQALTRASPRLRQLAVLDAVLEQGLAPREQALLPTAATLIERRFEHLRQADAQAVQAGTWLEGFRRDWRLALMAELDLRMQAVAGLIDALRNELTNQQ
jgi:hypothetical protein